ncbi:MAG TPA: TSUP family transporter, partial [Actinoplanes sp.]|nr:TSUP family transporter [Actinoplanes sp.]
PVIIGVLILVAIFVTVRPQMGLIEEPAKRTAWRRGAAVAVAGVGIAAYDGLIGPGTGTFLVLAFTTLIGADFVHGSAMAKIVNTATNLGALIVFAATGHVAWLLGAAMAVCNVVGALIGARMALRRGAGFVRIILLVVVLALIARLGYLHWQDA